jgi:DNA-binding NtrC family response regulator
MYTHTDVALILWNQDVIQLVAFALDRRNLKSCGVEPSDGAERIEHLIRSCSPAVVVFDLDPPYDRSATVALHLLHRFPECSFVMTCADSQLALKKAPWLSRYPMFQKPYHMDEIANLVRSMTKRARRCVGAMAGGTS